MSGEPSTGFQFGEDRRANECGGPIVDDYRTRRTRTSKRTSLRWEFARKAAGIGSLFAAMGSGAGISHGNFIESVETAQGTAMVFNQPGQTWWIGVVLMVVSVVMFSLAMIGGGTR